MRHNGSTAAVKPRPPSWAVAEGLVAEPDGENFFCYWQQAGFTQAEIDRALDLPAGIRDMANLRLGHQLRMRHLDRFDLHVCGRLLAAGGRFHHH